MEQHTPVLLEEVIASFAYAGRSTIVDATLGSAGHARALISRMSSGGTFIGIDTDADAIAHAKDTLADTEDVQVCLRHGNFRDIDKLVADCGYQSVHGVLADLGWRIEQFQGSGKGFSFSHNEPLLMTYGNPDEYPFTARDILNTWSEASIANVLYGYGEERYARRIARAVIARRQSNPIQTSEDFVEVIKEATPQRYHKARIHPATRSFQGLRIAVNDELSALEDFIDASLTMLEKGGRLSIITFHSIEDRIVKHRFREAQHEGRGMRITKKPIRPSREEINANPRARSAQLRIFQRD